MKARTHRASRARITAANALLLLALLSAVAAIALQRVEPLLFVIVFTGASMAVEMSAPRSGGHP